MNSDGTYMEFGVVVWHGSSEVLYKTFRKAETLGVWRQLISAEEEAKISSIKARRVTVQLGQWVSLDGVS